jgi:hypothetical protein
MIIMNTDRNPNHYTAEASDIGWAAGVWPTSFRWITPSGESCELFRAGMFTVAREFAGWEYRTVGRTPEIGMTVFND